MTSVSLTPRGALEQKTFRLLLDAMARPGTLSKIPVSEADAWYSPLVNIAESLVDHEVTFAATLDDNAAFVDAVLRQTGSRVAGATDADYVFCDADSLNQTVAAAKDGPFEYPDKGATVICLVESVYAAGGVGELLTLRGPGIKDEAQLWVAGMTPDAVEAIEERNAEPPLGIDIILVAPDGNFCCLTRYTTFVKEVL